MTAYQRGNRDGLLSFAILCEQRAEQERETARTLLSHRTMGKTLTTWHQYAAKTWMDAAALARIYAQALPEDPEGV